MTRISVRENISSLISLRENILTLIPVRESIFNEKTRPKLFPDLNEQWEVHSRTHCTRASRDCHTSSGSAQLPFAISALDTVRHCPHPPHLQRALHPPRRRRLQLLRMPCVSLRASSPMLTVFRIYTNFHNFLIFLGLRDFRVFIVLQMPSIAFECVRLHSSASSTYQVRRPRPRSCWGQ